MTDRNWRTTVESRLGVSLRAFQEQALDSLRAGRNVILSVPTGSGKTAVYQGASVLAKRLVVVVSPLVALLRDQLRRFDELELGAVGFWGEILGEDRKAVLDAVSSSRAKVLLTTPESLAGNPHLRDAILEAGGIGLLVIDEAHAYESSAYSFRSSYRTLGRRLPMLGQPLVLLCSATITSHGAGEAAAALDRWSWAVITRPPVRPNLTYRGVGVPHAEAFVAWLERHSPAPGICYAVAARTARHVCDGANFRLGENRVLCYTGSKGGMGDKDRRESQQTWMREPRWAGCDQSLRGWGSTRPTCAPSFTWSCPPRCSTTPRRRGARVATASLPSACSA